MAKRNWKPFSWILPVLLVLTAVGYAQPVMADEYFNAGLTYFNQRRYKEAAPYFEYCLRNSPWDSNAYYYAALSYHYAGDTAKAKQLYRQVVERFGASGAASMAMAALKRLDPNFQLGRRTQPATAASPPAAGTSAAAAAQSEDEGLGSAADLASLPNEARIYYTPSSNSMMVDAELNGRPIRMVFDTGAETCLFGKNHLGQLGIPAPTGPAQAMGGGVGSNKPIEKWIVRANLKLGPIMRTNFPVWVQDKLDTDPLLGQSFFRDFEYTVDTGAHSIVFKKRSAGGSATAYGSGGRDPYAVPFTKEGNEMVVDVEVNGRSTKMYFDTGAQGTIAFGKTHLGRVGLSVPEDAEEGISYGVGGQTKSMAFTIDRVKLGPIDKRDVKVTVLEESSMGKPLLGQGFFGDWQFTIDNANRMIRFVRR